VKNRAGAYVTNLTGELQYRSFFPRPLPPDPPIQLDEEASRLLSKAHRSLGILEGLSRQVPDIDLFVSMYVRKEALLSSQIEGTQATLDDILDPDIDENTNRHVADVVNYVQAAQYAKDRLQELPLSNRLLKETHQVLMQNVRGDEKSPGEFRRSQNWIGPQGSSLADAKYVPPNAMDMTLAMSELEKFLHAEDGMDPLVKIGLAHYQFETIHPFLDGNGRIGRLLVSLFLLENKILTHETLYISYFLKRNRVEYYDRLMDVRFKGHFEQWIEFFLLGVYESAEDAIQSIETLAQLHEKNYARLQSTGKAAKTMHQVFRYLESHPIMSITKTSEALGLSYNAVSKAVNRLIELGILVQTDNRERNRVFAYEEYLQALRKGT
jgi:Fic family protein